MTVRCKFRLDSITRSKGTVPKLVDGKPVKDEKGAYLATEHGEQWSLKFGPVYHNNDPGHENAHFWAWSPSGSFELTTINKAAVESMEIGYEYYLDIMPAGK